MFCGMAALTHGTEAVCRAANASPRAIMNQNRNFTFTPPEHG
jgi:hypothetical protein